MRVWSVLCGVVLIVIGIVLMVLWGIFATTTKTLPGNSYGPCKGYGAKDYLEPLPGNEHVLSWDNHRWVRYRSLMRLLEQTFNAIAFSIANPMPGERSYTELIMRSSDTKP